VERETFTYDWDLDFLPLAAGPVCLFNGPLYLPLRVLLKLNR